MKKEPLSTSNEVPKHKPALLDNGLSIQVPPFIEDGDDIIIDTRNLEYIKKI